MRTIMPTVTDVDRQWYVLDATDVVLGKLASQAARLLRGKHKPIFTPHVDVGDFVIVINADKVALTGNKWDQKVATHHSGYPGGLTQTAYSQLRTERPVKIVEKAIAGMIPHNKLGRQQLSKLKVYAGSSHPHAAQQPQRYVIEQISQ